MTWSTPWRSLCLESTSQPAAEAAYARAGMSPITLAPAMDKVVGEDGPVEPAAARSLLCRQRRPHPAGLSSDVGVYDVGRFMMETPFVDQPAIRVRSSSISTSGRRSTGMATWESGTTKPWPG